MQRAEVLDHARDAVLDRPNQYGAPEQNFDRIAARWNVHLLNAHPDDVKRGDLLNGTDVAIMLADMKLARLEHDPTHGDSWADLAGYAACGGEVSKATSVPRVKLELAPVPKGPKQIFGHMAFFSDEKTVDWAREVVQLKPCSGHDFESQKAEQAAAQGAKGAAFHTDRDFADETVENREFNVKDRVEFYDFDHTWKPGTLFKQSDFYPGRWSVQAENGRVWVKRQSDIRHPQVEPPCDVGC